IPGPNVIRLELDGPLVMLNGFIQFPRSGQGGPQVIVDLVVVRLELERSLIMPNGLIPPAFVGQCVAEVFVGENVFRRACQGVLPECEAVAPTGELTVSHQAKANGQWQKNQQARNTQPGDRKFGY